MSDGDTGKRFTEEKLEADRTPKALRELPDRDQLRADLESRLSVAAPVAVVFIDLDNFKQVNDRKGHGAGDACLERVVVLVSGAVAHKGRTYRYGGDEFAVLLPNFTSREAEAVGERIRQAIDEGSPDPDVKVTASIGVAGSDADRTSANGLIARGDEAAYASKFTGKNKVTLWPLDAEIASQVAQERERSKGR